MLICHRWISVRLKDGRRREEGEGYLTVFTRGRPKGVVLVRASSRRAWSHLIDMEATLAVTLHR
ncbi:hypothetical protein NQZ68_002024 [Dissostichus eleginoides]|nr:hypothetical protein NQZ68_002024 [Dissostichus eleginoides]